MHHRHLALFFIPLLCFALIVGGAHGSPFPRCKKASSRCVGFVIGFIVGFYVMIYAAWCLRAPELTTRDASATLISTQVPLRLRCERFDVPCSILVFSRCPPRWHISGCWPTTSVSSSSSGSKEKSTARQAVLKMLER